MTENHTGSFNSQSCCIHLRKGITPPSMISHCNLQSKGGASWSLTHSQSIPSTGHFSSSFFSKGSTGSHSSCSETITMSAPRVLSTQEKVGDLKKESTSLSSALISFSSPEFVTASSCWLLQHAFPFRRWVAFHKTRPPTATPSRVANVIVTAVCLGIFFFLSPFSPLRFTHSKQHCRILSWPAKKNEKGGN